ncbi:MAG: cytochrome-c oxidase, cbb3-type subunit I [Acidobacteria bacterium]|nr:cytochrome-c oxidase, cbb3-type subunit I [Acidobacteriota bacterium]
MDPHANEIAPYDDKVVKQFVVATLVWGFVGLLLGVIIAFQLASWKLNFGLPWISFGRLRPLHTNAAIFAFAGNAVFAAVYYSTQRLCKTRMFNDGLSKIHFWGWQLIIVLAAVTLLFGITTGKEYAELEWPVDILIAVVWVIFAVNFFGTLWRRREKHLYVALWFYIATIVTVAVLHIVNSVELPVSFLKSYPAYAGVQDALVQWWYGHNAVAFFLTTPFLGLMYYFVPKAVGRPIYSYRLSIVHFWALVFIYIWAGPHHLLYTALPDWAQTLGMVFSLMLWAPSWGGTVNGLLTMRGSWDKVRTEPVLKFLAAGVTFYGMSTFEGPLLSIKSVNLLAHYTDWIVAHVHGGTLGWNAFLTFGMLFYLVPKLWKTELYSKKLADYQFWLGFLGIMIYILSMWTAGVTQGLMLQAIDGSGRLMYPDFVATVIRIVPLYWVRAVGGTLFLLSFVLMLYNMWMTVKLAPKEVVEERPILKHVEHFDDGIKQNRHRKLEGLPVVMTVLAVGAILVGTIIEILPTITMHEYVTVTNKPVPYTALEVAGRDIYLREGCYNCHSQMIRPTVPESLRYGKPSQGDEFIYDHPFQWGSKRTGPDLARLGGKYPDMWHFRHMDDPRVMTPGSIMPAYTWMLRDKTEFMPLRKKLAVLKTAGVPYTADQIQNAEQDARAQAKKIADGLVAQGGPRNMEDREIVAMIAYLQKLGKAAPVAAPAPAVPAAAPTAPAAAAVPAAPQGGLP